MLLLVLGLSFTNENCQWTTEGQVCAINESSLNVSINYTDYCSQFDMVNRANEGCYKECTSIQSCRNDFIANYGNTENFFLFAARPSSCNESSGCATAIALVPTISNCSCAPNQIVGEPNCTTPYHFFITQSHCTGDMITLWPPSAVPYTAPTASPTTPSPADNTVLIVIIVVGVVLAGAGILYCVLNRKRPNNAANAASLLNG